MQSATHNFCGGKVCASCIWQCKLVHGAFITQGPVYDPNDRSYIAVKLARFLITVRGTEEAVHAKAVILWGKGVRGTKEAVLAKAVILGSKGVKGREEAVLAKAVILWVRG